MLQDGAEAAEGNERLDEAAVELLEFVRHGGQPLEAYQASAFADPVAASLGKVLAACHASYSAFRQTSSTKCAPADHAISEGP